MGKPLICALVIIGLAAFMLREALPPQRSEIRDSHLAYADREPLQFLSWNVGYAGLGAAEDFRIDGGSQWRVSGAKEASTYRDIIVDTLSTQPVSILFIQEAAGPSFMNRGVDLRAAIKTAHASTGYIYASQYRIRLPLGMSIEAGLALFGDGVSSKTATAHMLPQGGGVNIGRRFPLLVHRFTHNGMPYTALGAHLSAFDANGALRLAQLDEAMRVAIAEYEAGRRVVLGGDFNLELMERPTQGQVDRAHMAWLIPFPLEVLPPGWRIGSGKTVPTFRSVDAPYRPGFNYEGAIDGFIVSPNIEAACVSVIDLEFRASDHNPVLLTIDDSGGAMRQAISDQASGDRLPECAPRDSGVTADMPRAAALDRQFMASMRGANTGTRP